MIPMRLVIFIFGANNSYQTFKQGQKTVDFSPYR